MRVAWKDQRRKGEPRAFSAAIGPCFLWLRELSPHDSEWRSNTGGWKLEVMAGEDAAGKAIVIARETIVPPVATDHLFNLEAWVKKRAVDLARQHGLCKREHKRNEPLPMDVAEEMARLIMREINAAYSDWHSSREARRSMGLGTSGMREPVFTVGYFATSFFGDRGVVSLDRFAWWSRASRDQRRAAVQSVLNHLVGHGYLETSLGMEEGQDDEREVRCYSPTGKRD